MEEGNKKVENKNGAKLVLSHEQIQAVKNKAQNKFFCYSNFLYELNCIIKLNYKKRELNEKKKRKEKK